MVEFGLAKGLRDVVFAEGAHLPFGPRSFDVATTNHVLHLVPNWREVFAEIARVTQEMYFTVIERSQRVDSIQRDYDDLLREAGYEYHHPGIHERDLPSLVKPDMVIPVGPFHETVPADTLLKEFAGRAYSGQWDVPEPIHREAMTRLRQPCAGGARSLPEESGTSHPPSDPATRASGGRPDGSRGSPQADSSGRILRPEKEPSWSFRTCTPGARGHPQRR